MSIEAITSDSRSYLARWPLPGRLTLCLAMAAAAQAAAGCSAARSDADPGQAQADVGLALNGSLAFTPSEKKVSGGKIVDAEYSQSRAEFAWADDSGAVWVGKLDRATGAFVNKSGKSVLVDAEALSRTDVKRTVKTGPEWMETEAGAELVYTKFLPELPHDADNARIARALPRADGTWSADYIDAGLPRLAPYGSEDAGDAAPRITYVDPAGAHYYRDLEAPNDEVTLPFIPSIPYAVRHVRGDRSLVVALGDGDERQIFRYHVDTQALQQLTFDDGQKDRATVPWMWRAPELGGALVLMTVVDYAELRFYRSSEANDSTEVPWDLIHTVPAPAGGAIGSPEPFAYNGKSFVFFQTTTAENDEYPSQIWLTNIDAANPQLRLLSQDSVVRARIDPEVFATNTEAFIYFNRYDPSLGSGSPYCDACYEGVFRVATGLKRRAAR
jgi:hypothetical protein